MITSTVSNSQTARAEQAQALFFAAGTLILGSTLTASLDHPFAPPFIAMIRLTALGGIAGIWFGPQKNFKEWTLSTLKYASAGLAMGAMIDLGRHVTEPYLQTHQTTATRPEISSSLDACPPVPAVPR